MPMSRLRSLLLAFTLAAGLLARLMSYRSKTSLRFCLFAASLWLSGAPAFAQPLTTQPNVSNLLSQCSANTPVVGNGSGVAPKCHASGALGALAFIAPGTGVSVALAASLNASGGVVSPTPTRAGDIIYWNGSAWATLAGNNSGTQVFSENATGVPAWITSSGSGTVIGVVAGTAAVTGTCTTSCAVVSQTAPASWTPADGSGASLVFTNVSASYTQIGNMVFAYASLAYPTTASGSPAALAGFPVTAANHPYAVQCNVSYTSGLAGVKIAMIAGQTNALLYTPAGAAATNAQMTAGTINFMCIYPAT
jgi:hypothetical protein